MTPLEAFLDLQVLRIRQQLRGYSYNPPSETARRCMDCSAYALPDRRRCMACTERRKARAATGEFWHGTATGYTDRKCRCPKCRRWRRDYVRRYRACGSYKQTVSGQKPPAKVLRMFREVSHVNESPATR